MKEELKSEERANVKVIRQSKEDTEDRLKIAGVVHVQKFDAQTGQWLPTIVVPNLVTNTGRDQISSAIAQASAGNANYVAVSTSGTTHSAGSTTLTSEITGGGLARAQATYSHTIGADTYSLAYTWTATTGFTNVQQGGTFDAATAGRMSFVSTFVSVSLNNADQLALTWYTRVT